MKRAALLAFALAATPAQSHEPDFEGRVRAYLLAHPEVILEALDGLAERQRQEASRATAARALAVLAAADGALRYGDAGAPRVIYELFDYRCAVCRANVDTLRDTVARHPDVAVVKVHLPILSPVSEQAVRYVLAAQTLYGNDIYRRLHHALYDTLGPMGPARLRGLSAAEGLDHDAIERAMGDEAIDTVIDRNRDLAVELGVVGTPTFIGPAGAISGRVTTEDLLALLD